MSMSVISLASVLLGLYLLSNINKIQQYAEKLIDWMIYRNKINLRLLAAAAYLPPELVINSGLEVLSKWRGVFNTAKTYVDGGVEKCALIVELPGATLLGDGTKHFDSIEVNVNAAMVEFLHFVCKERHLTFNAEACIDVRGQIGKYITTTMPGYWYQIALAEERQDMGLVNIQEPILFYALTFSTGSDKKPNVSIQTGAFLQDQGYVLPIEWIEE